MLLASGEAFAPRATFGVAAPTTTSSSALSMGLFDFFSAEARQEREEQRERDIAEQERLQAQILELRANPDKMDDYHARVALRRRAIMEGKDASSVKVMVDDADKKEE